MITQGITYGGVYFSLNPKMAVGGVLILPPCGFSKNASSTDGAKRCVFVAYNIRINHIFSENFM